ncbi:ABC transporter substrate-binding protein [Pseudonocardia nematodicida]|uniref:ABC transporter substrate-binding protein n=1 Tax=Pseudonocardia nematodicida TaxID=1206997 RepID=A0ABV1K4I6_9PSEU
MRVHSPTPPAGLSRRSLLQLAGALAGAVTLSACGSGSGGTGSGSGAQTLNFGLSGEPATLRPGADQGAASLFVVSLLHRGLVAYDTDGEVVPALASEWDSADDQTFTFTLRPGLTFQDGTPLTSADVARTLEFLADPANSARIGSAVQSLDAVETPDETTVVVRHSEPNAAFLDYLADPSAGVLPESAFAADAVNTVGAGPFRMAGDSSGVGMSLERFDGYYDADAVQLDGVEISYYPDGNARTNALLSGEVDIIDYVPWESFDQVESDPDLTLDAQSGLVMYLAFNVDEAPFGDARVRRAVAHAINRDNAVASVFSGNARPVAGPPVAAESPFHEASLADAWAYDPDRARELLAEAGFPDGFAATLLTTSQYAFHQDLAVSVQADLAAVGVDVTLDNPDYATRIQQGNAGAYQMAVNGNGGIVNDPAFLSDFLVGPANYKRSFGFTDPEIEASLAEGLRTTDETARQEVYRRLQQQIVDATPFAMVSDRAQAFAYSSRVQGFANLPGFLTFHSGYTATATTVA